MSLKKPSCTRGTNGEAEAAYAAAWLKADKGVEQRNGNLSALTSHLTG